MNKVVDIVRIIIAWPICLLAYIISILLSAIATVTTVVCLLLYWVSKYIHPRPVAIMQKHHKTAQNLDYIIKAKQAGIIE